jgi:hypothetical protein
MKVKYAIKEIQFVGVILLKLYSPRPGDDPRAHVRVGLSLSPKSDHRLIHLKKIPSTKDFNAAVETIHGNIIRGVSVPKVKWRTPTEEEKDVLLYYVREFCRDEMVLKFLENGSGA